MRRTIGLTTGIKLESRAGSPGKRAYEVFVSSSETGLLIRVTGDIIALSPPLIVKEDMLEKMMSTLGRFLPATA
ncbi:hypothetical protein LAB1_54700 [Roseibium sp. LAB1]